MPNYVNDIYKKLDIFKGISKKKFHLQIPIVAVNVFVGKIKLSLMKNG
jgi:hypothetical protein